MIIGKYLFILLGMLIKKISRKKLPLIIIFSFLIFLLSKASFAANILAVRVWPSEDYTRITIESDKKLNFKQKILIHPHRAFIDLYEINLNETLKELFSKITPNDPQIIKVRVGQFQPKIVRIVFNLKTPVKIQTFTLQPIGNYHHRLVIDLYPEVIPDPLMALIEKNREKGKDSNQTITEKMDHFSKYSFIENSDQNKDPIDVIVSNCISNQTNKKINDTTITKTSKLCFPSYKDNTITPRIVTIAIDPGHGGEDPGAIGPSGTHEKTVVLDIGKRLRKKIDNQNDMQAMLTRDSDFFVPLRVRVQKAQRVRADLFVSIHADAFTSPTAHGSSVYALSEHDASSSSAYWLANQENSSDAIGGVQLTKQNPILSKILLDMSTSAQIRDSLHSGKCILDEISKINKLHKLNVEQAGFAVLRAPNIPSILVETAFISNPIEENKLKNETYREQIAEAIFQGIKRYFNTYQSVTQLSKNSLN